MKKAIAMFLLLSLFIFGCSQATYQPSSPTSNPASPSSQVGGGCGVAPMAQYNLPSQAAISQGA